jgi:hypothetical protein
MPPVPARPQISEDLRRFVLTSVPSVPFLEAILLLKGPPAVVWDIRTVARRLYLGESGAAALLKELVGSGVAIEEAEAQEPRYRYAPDPALAAVLDDLAHQYAIDLVGVTSLIHARVDKRALQFADAFRWKKDN